MIGVAIKAIIASITITAKSSINVNPFLLVLFKIPPPEFTICYHAFTSFLLY